MISKFDDIKYLFEEINTEARFKINLFVFGGAVLLYHKLKRATKDIDAVVNTKEEYGEILRVLKKLKFENKRPTKEYDKMNLSGIFIKEDYRIDLFHKKICKGFSLSEGMIKRARKVFGFERISVYLVSLEDVFLLKSMTEREGDIEDCMELMKKITNWNDMFLELKEQTKENEVWITWINERFILIERKGLKIPIAKEVEKLSKDYYKKLEEKLKEKKIL
jgi:predicted nucleotidyltransferase